MDLFVLVLAVALLGLGGLLNTAVLACVVWRSFRVLLRHRVRPSPTTPGRLMPAPR